MVWDKDVGVNPQATRSSRQQETKFLAPNDMYIDVSYPFFVIYLRSNVNIRKWETPLGIMFLGQEEETTTFRIQFGPILGRLSMIRSSRKIRVSNNPKTDV